MNNTINNCMKSPINSYLWYDIAKSEALLTSKRAIILPDAF